jgi:hypothetical protein
MLFRFNFFWKLLLSTFAAWIFYLFAGFELTVIMLLTIIAISETNDVNFLI